MARPPANVDPKFSGLGMAISRRASGLVVNPRSHVFNRQSKIGNRKLVHPPAIVRNEDRQFFHHELGLADGANHACPSGPVPLPGHALASVAAPALDVSATSEDATIDLCQIVFVQPGFTGTFDIVAVIEHETRPVRMAEIFETRDLHLISRLPVVQIVNDFLARAKPNEIDIELVADGPN